MSERPPSWPDNAGLVRRSLSDPWRLCAELGLLKGYKPPKQTSGLLIRCPTHRETTPSCSVTLGRDQTIRVRCFGCDWSGDALHLIAAAAGLDLRRDFRRVLALGAELGGVTLEQPPSGPRTGHPEPPKLAANPPPERPYPPIEEVRELWERCLPVDQAPELAAHLAKRGLEADRIADLDLARALPEGGPLPRWARYQGQTWAQTGHHLLLPMLDDQGEPRSLRAWRLHQGPSPKRLPPAGHRAGGLVLADRLGQLLLITAAPPPNWPSHAPLRVVITEGEPDFLTWATRFSDADPTPPAVMGVVAGSWTETMASRIPSGTRVTIRTDHDEAGERYAALIYRTLTGRCTVLRPRATPP